MGLYHCTAPGPYKVCHPVCSGDDDFVSERYVHPMHLDLSAGNPDRLSYLQGVLFLIEVFVKGQRTSNHFKFLVILDVEHVLEFCVTGFMHDVRDGAWGGLKVNLDSRALQC